MVAQRQDSHVDSTFGSTRKTGNDCYARVYPVHIHF